MAMLMLRFLLGGAIVSLFSVVGDVLRPKSFAGLFGASPAVALATLSVSIAQKGDKYGSDDGRAMAFGAVALLAYCGCVFVLMKSRKLSAIWASALSMPAWFIVAIAMRLLFGGR